MKGEENQECYRTACSNAPATWFNYSTKKYYCTSCAELINKENHREAFEQYGHDLCLDLSPLTHDKNGQQLKPTDEVFKNEP